MTAKPAVPLLRVTLTSLALTVGAAMGAPHASGATITSFDTWTLAEDPPHAGMSGTVDSSTTVTLTASGPIPSGTDIGYQSVDAGTVATSTSGHYFSPGSDFSIAVDFALTTSGSIGAGAIGLGIGEDGAGADSAGVAMVFNNGQPNVVSGAARVGDVTQPLVVLGLGSASGRLFVDYDAGSGNVGFGINPVQGGAAPTQSGTLAGIQDLWDDDLLLVSFFLRSQAESVLAPLTTGTVTATFSNFTVLSGTATSVVPVPAALPLFISALGLVAGLNRLGRSRSLRQDGARNA